ncbi:M23 family metallopeptidase [Bordetella avium]|uniref:Exported peptidase n=1 Tax=Bordetella avium (strain 197N) TaxID=360910 RepID=Q2KVH7_BORA1|nr:M23 family metallopeptidase [Bordetella avium]AZY50231.1 M23 family peptidase [Bordetella avium]AZY53624.1 M23 family peptidase [Bordetella avium]RIQ11629.1 M23 family peptidase [Bordetella avium]RIQ16220.1 M23 family peptidase [Bordetella avium]RIQ30928.1 M23 family peptidase [Bordetella avium]
MHARSGQDRHFTVGGGRLVLLMGLALMAAAMFGAGMQRLLFGQAAAPYAVDWPSYARAQANRDADFMRENVNMLASKVGILQAKLASIDGLGRRVAEIAGLKYAAPEQMMVARPLDEATYVMDDLFTDRQPPTPESAEALGRQLDDIQTRMTEQADNLKLLDAALTSHSAEQARVPTALPIKDYPYLSSSYGWRRNPVTGRYAMHEGLDFSAPPGTPILAASGGVVLLAKAQPGYGNMVEIDHGNGLITRYAHASRLLVKAGDVVERGQEVARVGSSGRSTGPHLHFEVRLAGQPLDPRLFLGTPQAQGSVVAQAQQGKGAANPAAP